MGLIIHHRATRNVFRFSLTFLAPVFLLTIPSVVRAQGYDQAFAEGMLETVEMLGKEIARDEEIAASAMTIPHLRQMREKLKADLGRKEKTLTAIKMVKYPAIESAVQAVEDTFNAENQIIADTRINEAVQIRAFRALRANLPRKRQALADMKSWLKTNPY